MMFKVYHTDTDAPIFCASIADLAELCGVTQQEARRAYYRMACVLGGFEVLNIG